METQGNIQAVKQRDKGYSVQLNSEWYSGFGKTALNKGDTVKIEFDLSEDKQWKNIKKVEKIKGLMEAHKEAREDKTAAMLTSYAKDLYIAMKQTHPINGEDAARAIAIWYKIIKEEIEGGRAETKKEVQ